VDSKNPHEALLEPLLIALGMEEEGKRLFLEACERASGRHARRTFEFLAAEEDHHIAQIKSFYESIRQSGGSEPPDVDETSADRRLAEFEDKLGELRHELKPTMSDAEAFRFALKFENGAEDYYRQKIAESDNPNVQRFYRWLIGEEEMHSRLLKSCLEFAEDPAAWFHKRSR